MTKKILFFAIGLGFGYLLYLLWSGTLPMALDIVTGIYYPWLNVRYLGLSTWTPVHNPYISDVTSQAVVWRIFLSDHIRNLSSIFWHNYSLSGYPYLGSAYLTPLLHPSTLFLFLPPQIGISLVFIFQLLAVFVAGYYYLRSLKLDAPVAIIAAIALSLGGQLTTWFELGALNYVVASLLLVLTLIKKGKYLFLPPAIFLLVNSGHYQYVIYSLIVVVVYGASQKAFIRTVFSTLIGLLLSMVILFPTLYLYKDSIRESDNFLSLRNNGLISVKHLITLVNPDHFGNPATYNYTGEEDYQEKSPYVGVLLLPLFVYGLSVAIKKKKLFFPILTLLSLLLMTDNPVSQSFFRLHIPLLGASKGSRPLVLFDLGLIITAFLSLPDLLRNRIHLRWVAATTFIFGFGYLLYIIPTYDFTTILELIRNAPSRELANSAVTAFRTGLIPVALSLLFAAVLFIRSLGLRLPVLLILGLLLFADLSRYFSKYNTFAKAELFYPATPEFEYLQNQAQKDLFRTEYYGTANVPMNIWEAYGLESASGYTSIYPKRYGEFVGIVNDDKINLHPGRFVHIYRPQSPLFDLLNIKYVLVNFADCPDGNGNNIVCQVVQDDKFKQVFAKDNMAIYENTKVLPRFFFPQTYQVISDKEMAPALSSPTFNPRQVMYLEKDPSLSSPLGSGKIKVTRYTSTQINLSTTDVTDQALLYIGNNYDPGWSAKVDGQSTPIYHANYTFSAVPVPPGDHEVILTYSPRGLFAGLVTSLVTLLFYLGLAIIKPKLL